jgi:hypothetical protein
MGDEAWKRHERIVARRFGVERNGPAGHTSGPDANTETLYLECKERKELPKWFLEPMAKAVKNATKKQLAVVVWHPLGGRHDADLVVMRLVDFERWWKVLGVGGE